MRAIVQIGQGVCNEHAGWRRVRMEMLDREADLKVRHGEREIDDMLRMIGDYMALLDEMAASIEPCVNVLLDRRDCSELCDMLDLVTTQLNEKNALRKRIRDAISQRRRELGLA
ncbi:MAG TPA: hypothetical protein PLU30_12635 [Verrucomicrobiae bacterium]|nr:hypothetical protein [Verrucomicrobiae bacterium]